MGTHTISSAGDPFYAATHPGESERLLGCDDCGRAFPRKKLIELGDADHDDLRFFNGWRICKSCARRSAVEY